MIFVIIKKNYFEITYITHLDFRFSVRLPVTLRGPLPGWKSVLQYSTVKKSVTMKIEKYN